MLIIEEDNVRLEFWWLTWPRWLISLLKRWFAKICRSFMAHTANYIFMPKSKFKSQENLYFLRIKQKNAKLFHWSLEFKYSCISICIKIEKQFNERFENQPRLTIAAMCKPKDTTEYLDFCVLVYVNQKKNQLSKPNFHRSQKEAQHKRNTTKYVTNIHRTTSKHINWNENMY